MKSLSKTLAAAAAAAGAAVLALILTGCSPAAEVEPDPSPTSSYSLPGTSLDVAVYTDAPPVEYIKDGELTGWMVELLDQLADELGIEVNVVQVGDFSTIIPGLQAGRFEAAAATITVTEERMAVIDMVTVHAVGTGFLALADNGPTIDEGLDVCGLRVAALSGSVYATQMDDLNADCSAAGESPATVDLYPNTSAAELAVQSGRNDAFLGSYGSLAYTAALSDGELAIQDFQFGKLPGSIGFVKGSPWAVPFRDALNALIQSGAYQATLDKFGVPDVAIEESVINPTL